MNAARPRERIGWKGGAGRSILPVMSELTSSVATTPRPTPARESEWSPMSWQRFALAHGVAYEDQAELARALDILRSLPPLVTSFEVERLKRFIAEAQDGERFILQGGDCAETVRETQPEIIANKLKILLQMSLVLIHATQRPVTRVGRFAGQYAKPRSRPTETRVLEGVEQTLPNYFGDLINRPEFTAAARRPDPMHLVTGYKHAALTINFIRSLVDSGFADLHHPEYWDLSFMDSAVLSDDLREEYQRTVAEVGQALRFMEALGDGPVEELHRVEFFTSHEGLNLLYESAQTRSVPRRTGHYDLTTHLPWIGERTRQLDGAHVEFFRGIRNPVGVKVGPSATPDIVLGLLDVLNPENEPGKIVLITRMGADKVEQALPNIVRGVHAAGRKVLWMSDPMHGNTQSTSGGLKTRPFEAIQRELEAVMAVHRAEGTWLGGVHFELTGDDVTECVGGAEALTEEDLERNYTSACDPRLNYRQALEMTFQLGRGLKA